MTSEDERPDVTTEALNMLEAYLHFESLNELELKGDSAAQGDTGYPSDSFQSSGTPCDLSANSLRKKFAWLDPLNRVEHTSPGLPRFNKQSDHRCSLCGKDVSDQRRKSRSALSAQCSPERRIPLETRNSLPFGCERLLHSGKHATCSQKENVPVFTLPRAEEVSDLEGLLSPCPPPLIEFSTSDSQPQSVYDKTDGLESFQRQQSSFSTSASTELCSLPNSRVPSRTPSQLKVQNQVQNTLSPSGDSQSVGWVLRSHSAGSNVLQKPNLVHPSVHWTSPSGSDGRAVSYMRCESVHSAPGDAHHRVDLEKAERDSTRKWFRFSLPRARRKSSKLLSLPRNSGSFSVSSSTNWSLASEQPLVTDQKQSKQSRSYLGLDSLLHLIPRWFRGHDTSPDTYVSTGFPVRLRRSVFRNASRRKRRKVYEQTNEKSDTNRKSCLRVPNLSPIYIPDRLGGHRARAVTKCSDAGSGAVESHDLVQNGGLVNVARAREQTSPTALSEVSRLYEEIIHTAEGGRLCESTVQRWRSFTDKTRVVDNPGTSSDVLPPTDSSVSHMNPSSPTFLSLSRPLSSIDELHSTCSYNQFHQPSSSSKPDQIIITSENDGRLDHVYQIASDPTTPDATSLNRELTRSDSQTSHTKSSASSSDSPIVFSPLPGKPPEPPFCDNHLSEEQTISMKAEQNVQQYAVYVAAMIDVLSQRIMNQITEDDLDRRLQRLEVEAVASLSGTGDTATNASATSTDVRKFDQVIPSPESIRNSDAASVQLARRSAPESDYRKSSLLTESHTIERVLLAQVRRLERRKKLDIKIDLLNHLPRHTQYTTFEADMLRLLGRQPSWHHIAILYYLARCTVRHVLKMHLAELNTLQRATGNELPDESARLRSFSSAAMLVELNQVERARRDHTNVFM